VRRLLVGLGRGAGRGRCGPGRRGCGADDKGGDGAKRHKGGAERGPGRSTANAGKRGEMAKEALAEGQSPAVESRRRDRSKLPKGRSETRFSPTGFYPPCPPRPAVPPSPQRPP